MNHTFKKGLAVLLCCTILAGGAGATVFAMSSGKAESKGEETSAAIAVESDQKLQKDETVYVLAGADGSVKKIIVSDWIKNTLSSNSITDTSELRSVENVKGDETYTLGGENTRVWDAEGHDIYYQGNLEKELPVSLCVSYKLDGKSISPEALAGQSGRVTIRFDYKNNQYEMVEIDGRSEKIYVPYAMLTGLLLDNEAFANVEVSNGKLVNDGDRTIVAGLAFPGMESNLNIDRDKLTIPDYIEITADVQNFEMHNTVTLATNEIFSQLNTEKLNSAEELSDSMDELQNAMKQLLDGSSALYDGLCTLLNKSGELISGVQELASGAARLNTGAETLEAGISGLSDGAEALADGLEALSGYSDTLNVGSREVFMTLLGAADTQLAAAGLQLPMLTPENYAEVLNGAIASLAQETVAKQAEEAALQKVTSAVNEKRALVVAEVEKAIRSNVEEQILASQGMTKEQYATAIETAQIPPEQQSRIADTVDAQMQTEAVQTRIAQETKAQLALLIEQSMDSAEVKAQLAAALESARAGADAIVALKKQLDSYNSFYTGLLQYTSSADTAKDGAKEVSDGASALKAGAEELRTGAGELYDGILLLKDGMPALTDGVTALRDGAMKLSDGLKAFDEKGIQKLVTAAGGDLGTLLTRVRATVDVSKKYTSFSGLSGEMDGQVKFIYRTDSISVK